MKILKSILIFFLHLFFSYEKERKRREEEDTSRESAEEKKNIEEEVKKAQKKIIKVAKAAPTTESFKGTDAERLQKALDYVVELEFYKRKKGKDGNYRTYCNVLSRKFLLGNFDYGLYNNNKNPDYDWLNYDIQQVFFEKDINTALYGTNTTSAYPLVIDAVKEGRVTMLSSQEAQAEANKGVPIWGCRPGHEIIIYPDSGEYNNDKGPKIAQAGWTNIANIYANSKYCWGANWEKWRPDEKPDIETLEAEKSNDNQKVIFIKFPMRTEQMP